MYPNLLERKFFRYFLAGSAAALLQFLALVAGIEILRFNQVASAVFAFILAVTVNYFLQRTYTFKSDVRHTRALPRFFSIATLLTVINTLIFSILVRYLHYLLAQAVATLIIFTLNFELNKRLTF